MRGLLGLLVLVLGAGLVAELLLPDLLEERVEEQVQASTRGVADVTAELGDGPLLPGLLLQGRVSSLDLRLREVAGREVTVGDAELELRGIELDRRALLGGAIEVTDVEAGVARLRIVDDRIASVGEALERLGPTASDLGGRALELAGDVVTPADTAWMPCQPTVEVEGDRLLLECAFDQVPEFLREATLG